MAGAQVDESELRPKTGARGSGLNYAPSLRLRLPVARPTLKVQSRSGPDRAAPSPRPKSEPDTPKIAEIGALGAPMFGLKSGRSHSVPALGDPRFDILKRADPR